MALNLSLWTYIKAAFNAKFLGMFISPGWVVIAAFGFLGLVINPGFFLIGTGLELAYLFTIATHPRFQGYIQSQIQSKRAIEDKAEWQSRIGELIQRLDGADERRFHNLENQCSSILDFYSTQLTLNKPIIEHHRQSLNKFIWIFLQLLLTKRGIEKLTEGAVYLESHKKFETQIQELDNQISKPGISDELRKSLESKRDIVKMRLQTLTEAKQKLTYVIAELERIEQQVALIREQAVVNRDSQGIANRIDLVSASLNQTNDWIKQQEDFLGYAEDLSGTTPSILPERQKTQEDSK